MKTIYMILLLALFGCNTNGLKGIYKSFWYETYHEIILAKNNKYEYKSEGHLGGGEFKGKYNILGDTLILYGEIEEYGLNKFLILDDGCLVELETRFDFCEQNEDTWYSSKRSINYPQLKEKSIKEKEDVVNMLGTAFEHPKIREYFKDTTMSLIVQEYYEINRSNKLGLSCFGLPINLMSKEEIESNHIEKYLIIDQIDIGWKSATIDFQVMPEFSVGILVFFNKKDGIWKIRKTAADFLKQK